MEPIRFKKFSLLIDGIHKSVHNLKVTIAPHLGVKGVHVLWIYELAQTPEGLTAAELAARNNINRSLISREIEALMKDGYVSTSHGEGARYNDKLILTGRGVELANRIRDEVVALQAAVDEGISEEELLSLYATLEKINNNFKKIGKNIKKRRINDEQEG
jgi:DNA-binding MarR family transcriptional regulator